MQLTHLLISLTHLLNFAIPSSAAPKKPIPFRLRIPLDAPVPSLIAGKYLTKNNLSINGFKFDMGSGLSVDIPGPPAEFIIKPSAGGDVTRGEVTEKGNATSLLWLRPTHGTPSHFVRLGGDPEADAFPFMNYRTDWTISGARPNPISSIPSKPKDNKLRYRLVYGWNMEDVSEFVPAWTACKWMNPNYGVDQVTWKIFFGFYGNLPLPGSGEQEGEEGCTAAFDLEVVF